MTKRQESSQRPSLIFVLRMLGNTGEGSVSIRCPYESKYQKKLKYICRGNQPSTCLQQALITSNNRQNGRFTLSHDQKSETFTVTILNLTLEDSGSYLCGVQTDTGLDVFSATKLEVKGERSYLILQMFVNQTIFYITDHQQNLLRCQVSSQQTLRELAFSAKCHILLNINSKNKNSCHLICQV
uniref:Immunoglobulin V-set domain-containing protein n=1 Tax=Kryptolebias marmoratus TaxID=37003 RepID=A0A3Q2ZGX1_KRYMA